METKCRCGRSLIVDDLTSQILKGRHCKTCGHKFFYHANKYSLVGQIGDVQLGAAGFRCRNCGMIFTDATLCKAVALQPQRATREEIRAAKAAASRPASQSLIDREAFREIHSPEDEAIARQKGMVSGTIDGRTIAFKPDIRDIIIKGGLQGLGLHSSDDDSTSRNSEAEAVPLAGAARGAFTDDIFSLDGANTDEVVEIDEATDKGKEEEKK